MSLGSHAAWEIDPAEVTYGQRIGNVQLSRQTGLSTNSNYIRNSVKAVVDAYTGEVTFYVVDDEDPIVRAWQGAFPEHELDHRIGLHQRRYGPAIGAHGGQ